MNPFQHGEVFVTEDGAETDLDIGHYERFLDVDLDRLRERDHRPGLLGGDRQGAPRRVPRRHRPGDPAHHQRDQGADARAGDRRTAGAGRDHHRDRRHRRRHRVAAVPRGGPPGPPGRRPRQRLLPARLARALPRRRAASSRPSRPSTRSPRCAASASSPTRIVCRADREIPEASSARSPRCATSTPRPSSPPWTRRASTTSPRSCTTRASTRTSSGGSAWPSATSSGRRGTSCCGACTGPAHRVEIALVGKYIDLPDAYLSVTEALRAGGFAQRRQVDIRWVASDDCETPEGARRSARRRRRRLHPRRLRRAGHRGQARRAALGPREPGARRSGSASACSAWSSSTPGNVAGLDGAAAPSSTRDTPHPVIATMEEQRHIVDGAGDLGGTMRLGSYPAVLAEGSIAREVYGAERVEERHRHRYEVNNAYRRSSRRRGWSSPASRPTARWWSSSSCPARCTRTTSSTQAHPEFKSRPTVPTRCSAGSSRRRSPCSGRAPARGRRPAAAGRRAGGDRRCRSATGAARASRRATGSSTSTSWTGDRATTAWSGTSRATPSTSATAGGRRASTWSTPAPWRSSRWTTTAGWPSSSSTGTPSRMVLWELPAGPAGRRRRGRRSTRRSASSPRRPTCAPSAGTCWSTAFNSPGGTNEALRLYLARGLSDGARGRPARARGRGAGMEVRWVPLERGRDAVLAGRPPQPGGGRRDPRRVRPGRRAGARCGPPTLPWPEHPAFASGLIRRRLDSGPPGVGAGPGHAGRSELEVREGVRRLGLAPAPGRERDRRTPS